MEACVQIPVPAASDVESVVTALEMAALFGAKGEGTKWCVGSSAPRSRRAQRGTTSERSARAHRC